MPHTPSLNTASSTKPAQADASGQAGPNLSALLDASPNSILKFDRDFRIIYANAQAIQLSQLAPDGSIGQIYWDLSSVIRGTVLEENFLIAMRERSTRHFEFFH
ncbi:MAG: PAS domain-containing protein, partial [Edaphobacter sp.]